MTESIQNTVSGGFLSAGIISFFTQWNPVLSGLLAITGLIWFGVLMHDRWRHDYPKN